MSYINANEYPLLDIKAEKEMITKAQSGDKQAFDYMVISNTRLVKDIIKTFSRKGIEADDLFQVGVMGLMTAIKKYDINNGAKFSTYATWWIRQQMIRTIQNQSRTIRIPANAYEKNYRLIAATKQLEQELGRNVTIEELAEYAECEIDKVKKFRLDMVDTCSLNQITSSDNKVTELGDSIADKTDMEMKVITEIANNNLIETIKNCLTEREFKIFCMKTGIGYNPLSFREISEEFNISHQRIQQIYKNATGRLKRKKSVKMFVIA